MYLIVGLGNPGSEYKGTRHNMGFETVDKLSEKLNIIINTNKFKAKYGLGSIEDEKIILAKPQTYMNLSGNAIRELKNYYKLTNDRIIVICDDIDLDIGKIRIRKQGSSGTHNGLKSVVEQLGATDFQRIRIGVGKPENSYDLINYVIGKISKEEKEVLDKSTEIAAEAAIEIVKFGISKAMNEFNGRES